MVEKCELRIFISSALRSESKSWAEASPWGPKGRVRQAREVERSSRRNLGRAFCLTFLELMSPRKVLEREESAEVRETEELFSLGFCGVV